MIVETPEKRVPTSSGPTPHHRGRTVLLGGVAAACVLGVGLGLWARPQMQERRAAATPPPGAVEAAPKTARQLQIVVDARPPALVQPAPVRQVEPSAPVRAPEGFIRTQALRPAAAPPEPVRLANAEPTPRPMHGPRREPSHAAQIQFGRAQTAKAQADKAQLARAQIARDKAVAAKVKLAKAEAIQASKAAAHRQELAQLTRTKAAAKAQKAEAIRLAQAEARGRAEAREEARQEALADARKRARLAALSHALARAVQHRPQPPVEMAKVERRRGHKVAHEPRVEQASLKTRHGHEPPRFAAAHPARARPEPVAPQPANGLMRVSTTSRCASRDPGEAVVCADPSLGAAERQLTRAYQGARAAGVPDSQLRSQQQHWLAARSAAAREAPWAVRDVYMARIAELNGQAKDAQSGY